MAHCSDRTVFDREAMLERMGGDAELLGEIVALFIEDSPRMLEAVREAVDARDAHRIERSAHSLKGALLNLAAESAANSALAVERVGRDGEIDTVDTVFADLEAEMDRLRATLDACSTS